MKERATDVNLNRIRECTHINMAKTQVVARCPGSLGL